MSKGTSCRVFASSILLHLLLAARCALSWRPRNLGSVCWASLLVAMCCQGGTASAQTYPTMCKPVGTHFTCIARPTTPYRYLSVRCSPLAYFPSESAALAFVLADSLMQPPNACNVVPERLGWGTPSSLNYFARCGGVGSYFPGFQYGVEVSNVSKYRFEWDDCVG